MSTTTISVNASSGPATSSGNVATAAAVNAGRMMVLQKQTSTPIMPISNAPKSPLGVSSAGGLCVTGNDCLSKCRHNSNASTRSSNSTSSSLDEPQEHTGSCPNNHFMNYHAAGAPSHQMNELVLDSNHQTIAIEMPANSMRIELDHFRPASEVHPEPGDIVEFDRTLYSHWAIYVGDGDVVQIADSPDSEIAHVQRVPMATMAGDNFLRVNNKLLRAKERNMLPFHNEIVVRKALSKVGSSVPYNALQCNSEHYVTEWKYGHRWSDQAQMSLSSFRALRSQHSNSISEVHQVFMNTLNEVLNSPAAISSNSSPQLCSPSSSSAGSHHHQHFHNQHHASMGSNSNSPISLSRLSSVCSSSNGSAGNAIGSPTISPKTSLVSMMANIVGTPPSPASQNTAASQTELSLL